MRNKSICLLVFISLFFVYLSDASAQVISCKYEISFRNPDVKAQDIFVNIDDDGEAVLGNSESDLSLPRIVGNNGQVFSFSNSSSFSKYMYDSSNKKVLSASCPNLFLCESYNNTGNRLQYGANACLGDEDGKTIKSTQYKSFIESDVKDLSKLVCVRYMTDKFNTTAFSERYNDGSLQYRVRFLLNAKGEKVWTISTNVFKSSDDVQDIERSSPETDISGEAILNSKQFHLSESIISKAAFWDDDKCQSANLYFKKNSDSRYELVDEKPNDFENASPDDSNGVEENRAVVDSPTNPSGNSNSFTPAKLCEDGDCDISIDSFCDTAPVKRTFKFIGMTFVIFKVLIPLVLVGIGVVNLVQVIIAGKDEDMKKRMQGLVKRIIIGIVIFLLPGIIDFLFDSLNGILGGQDNGISTCEDCLLDLKNCD